MKLIPVSVAAGETIFRQGDPGDRFYVVEDGRCEICDRRREGPRRVARRGVRGDRAPARRPAHGDRDALEDTKLLALERDEFIAAVTGHAPSREAADA